MTAAYDADELYALSELGYALVQAGAFADARALWEGLATIHPSGEAAFRMLALIAREERRPADVVALAGAALERHPGPEAALLRAEGLLELGRFGEARRDLEWILQATAGREASLPLRRRALAWLARLRRPG